MAFPFSNFLRLDAGEPLRLGIEYEDEQIAAAENCIFSGRDGTAEEVVGNPRNRRLEP